MTGIASIQPLPAIMTTKQVAALLWCSEDTVARYVNDDFSYPLPEYPLRDIIEVGTRRQ